MTLDMGNTDKLSEFRRDAERLGIKVERPAINHSGVEFDVADGKIFYALGAIKGGRAAVESVVAARQAAGPFRDLADLARRIDTRLVNRRTLEALIAAGALDELEADRARAMAAIDGMLALSNRIRDEAAAGQFDLLGGGVVQEAFRIPQVEPWAPAEKLKREHEAVGFFLSGHPLDDYEHVLKRLRVQRYADFAQTVRANGTGVGKVAVSVIDKSERRTKSGSKMGIVNLSDPSGQFEAVLFSEGLMKLRDLLEPGRALVLRLSAVLDGEEVRPRIEDAEELDGLAARQKQDLLIYLRDEKAVPSIAERIRPRGEAARSDGKVSIVMILDDGAQEVEIELPGKFPVSQQIANAVRAAPGVVSVELR